MALRRVSGLPDITSGVTNGGTIDNTVLSNCIIEVSYRDTSDPAGSSIYKSYKMNLYDALSAFVKFNLPQS